MHGAIIFMGVSGMCGCRAYFLWLLFMYVILRGVVGVGGQHVYETQRQKWACHLVCF